MSGKELFIRFTARAFSKLLSIYVFSYFPFGFEGRMWDWLYQFLVIAYLFTLNMCCFQFWTKITTFFDQEKFGTAPLLYVAVEMFGRKLRENDVKTSKIWRKNGNIVILTSCTRVVLHPSCKTTFPSPIGFTEIPVGYARTRNLKYEKKWHILSRFIASVTLTINR